MNGIVWVPLKKSDLNWPFHRISSTDSKGETRQTTYILPCLRTSEKLSYGWSHHSISSTNSRLEFELHTEWTVPFESAAELALSEWSHSRNHSIVFLPRLTQNSQTQLTVFQTCTYIWRKVQLSGLESPVREWWAKCLSLYHKHCRHTLEEGNKMNQE